MNLIKYILLWVIVIGTFTLCTKEDEPLIIEIQPHVRFNFLTDNNNEPLEFPALNALDIPKSRYENTSIKTLKIPVILSSSTLSEVVNVDYSVNGTINSADFNITPVQLSFNGNQLSDTLYVKFNKRLTENDSIVLKIDNVSDTSIKIGSLNSLQKNDSFTITFNEIELTYSFNTNRKEISGNINESFDFSVLFKNGFIPSDIENVDVFSQPNTFDYTITKKANTKEDEIEFTLTVNENIADEVSLDAFLNLLEIPNYLKGANQSLQINKPIKIDRDGNPAVNFYNISDPFFRLRGEYWRPDTDNPGSCEWFATNIFSVPVIVDKTNPNGIFISDNGTPNDENDDIYHHRFKIGFKSPTGLGINVFAIRSLIDGESSISPGLNLDEAVEFFPLNGNSTTEGTMAVVSQNLIIIRTSDDKAFSIPISGVGTYKLIDASTNVWQMKFEITYDFSQVNGTIITLPMFYNNSPGQPEPALVNNQCYEEIQL
jgi:hypothetical protein